MANVAHIGERMLFQLAGKVVAFLFCLFVQFVVPHEIDGGAPGCADQWTSPKGAAVFPDRCLYLVRADRRAHRQSSADCFGEAEDVRFQVEVTARCGSGFWGSRGAVSENGRLRHGEKILGWGRPPPEGAKVAYAHALAASLPQVCTEQSMPQPRYTPPRRNIPRYRQVLSLHAASRDPPPRPATRGRSRAMRRPKVRARPLPGSASLFQNPQKPRQRSMKRPDCGN